MNPWFPVLLSLKVAAISTALSFILGLGLARLLLYRRGLARTVLEPVILLPMVMPPTVLGYVLLSLLGKRGPIGSMLSAAGISVIFTWVAAVIASTVVSLPLMYQSCRAALRNVDEQYAAAARTLGLGEARIFFRIVLPLAAPGVIAGTALSFARALGEFGATLMIAGNIPGRTQTLPMALYLAVEAGRDGDARRLLLVSVAAAFALILVIGACERASFSQARGGTRA